MVVAAVEEEGEESRSRSWELDRMVDGEEGEVGVMSRRFKMMGIE